MGGVFILRGSGSGNTNSGIWSTILSRKAAESRVQESGPYAVRSSLHLDGPFFVLGGLHGKKEGSAGRNRDQAPAGAAAARRPRGTVDGPEPVRVSESLRQRCDGG